MGYPSNDSQTIYCICSCKCDTSTLGDMWGNTIRRVKNTVDNGGDGKGDIDGRRRGLIWTRKE